VPDHGLAHVPPQPYFQYFRGTEEIGSLGIPALYLNDITAVFYVWAARNAGSAPGHVFPKEPVCIGPVPEGRPDMPAGMRNLFGIQFKEEDTAGIKHLAACAVDNKSVSLQKPLN
jgi:hypothetical protein